MLYNHRHDTRYLWPGLRVCRASSLKESLAMSNLFVVYPSGFHSRPNQSIFALLIPNGYPPVLFIVFTLSIGEKTSDLLSKCLPLHSWRDLEAMYLQMCMTMKPSVFSRPSAPRRFAHQSQPLQPPADSPDYRVLPNTTFKSPTADAATEAASLHWCRQ